jgi:hypothetical protein
MHSLLVLFHSVIRYFVLIFLVIVIVRSLQGLIGRKEFTTNDNKLGTWLLMLTHMQFLIGLVLYFVSPAVIFGENTMKDPTIRYWTVEHGFMMIMAVGLITAGRVIAKRQTDHALKHRRMFLFCSMALLLILWAIATSGRGLFSLPAY